ncbi:glycosyltransferase family 39 protein [Candidatus Poribacteria bacterium]|nr:glycosyltransferase family 39 protein [Candidatus Poribacteria bacterium]
MGGTFSGAKSGQYFGWAAFLLVLVAITQFAFVTRHSLWNDEFITYRSIQAPPAEIVRERLHANHAPGYFLLLKAWTQLAGESEFALRFPSALASFLGIVLVWRLAHSLYGWRLGLLGLALAGFCQVHIESGSTARMYSMLFAAAAAGLLGTVLYLDTGRRRYLGVAAAAGLFGLPLQLLYFFVPAAIVPYLIWNRRLLGDRFRPALVAQLAPVAVCLPVLVMWALAQHKVGHAGWHMADLTVALRRAGRMFLGGEQNVPSNVYQAVVALMVTGAVYGVAWSWKRQPSQVSPHTGLFLLWCSLPPVVMTIANMKTKSNLVGVERYYVTVAAAAPLILIEAVRLLANLGKKRLAVVYATAMVAVSLTTSAGYLLKPGQGLREAAAYLKEHRTDETELVICSRNRARTLAFTYYGATREMPLERPPEVKKYEEIAAWMRTATGGVPSVWIVFYDDDESVFADVLRSEPRYRLDGGLFTHGQISVGHYAVISDERPEPGQSPAAFPPLHGS